MKNPLFADDIGNFNTMSGPIEKKQMVQFFSRRKEEELPGTGFYFDIDYWVKPERNMMIDDINSKVRHFSERSWDRFQKICGLIMKD